MELNLRQRRWLQLMKDYDLTLQYHLGKVNVVANALSRKSSASMACLLTQQKNLLIDLEELSVKVCIKELGGVLDHLQVQPTLLERITTTHGGDIQLQKIIEGVQRCEQPYFEVNDGILRLRSWLCIPDDTALKDEILREAHSSRYSVYPSSTKMDRDLRGSFQWSGMKKEIADFVAQCLLYQQVKVEHQRPIGLLQPFSIPKWKQEHIMMNFISGLLRVPVRTTQCG